MGHRQVRVLQGVSPPNVRCAPDETAKSKRKTAPFAMPLRVGLNLGTYLALGIGLCASARATEKRARARAKEGHRSEASTLLPSGWKSIFLTPRSAVMFEGGIGLLAFTPPRLLDMEKAGERRLFTPAPFPPHGSSISQLAADGLSRRAHMAARRGAGTHQAHSQWRHKSMHADTRPIRL